MILYCFLFCELTLHSLFKYILLKLHISNLTTHLEVDFMANLEALFNDNGLQAIIPYAVGAAAQGYKFLCQKLRDGVSFWIIVSSDSKMPFFLQLKRKSIFLYIARRNKLILNVQSWQWRITLLNPL